jgi:hypothetical protein
MVLLVWFGFEFVGFGLVWFGSKLANLTVSV